MSGSNLRAFNGKRRPRRLAQPYPLRWSDSGWVLMVPGVTRTLPHLLSALHTHGFKWTVCTDPQDWYDRRPTLPSLDR